MAGTLRRYRAKRGRAVTLRDVANEYAFEMAASNVRFGAGVTREVGDDVRDLGLRRVLVVTDPVVARLAPMQVALQSLADAGIETVVYDRVRVEPTDLSFKDAIAFARDAHVDGYVAVGGGSVMDTAKAANLYVTHPPADFLDYVNAPIGKAMPVPGPVQPLIAIPTTAGTGSETTGVSIFDLTSMHAKTGIASRRLKPTLGLLDPANTRTMPPQVAASSGLDILSHAIESFTALPYANRPRPDRPALRPAYQGSNPISDVWSLQALRMVARSLVRAVEDPGNDEARAEMILAASYAGVGFGNAGVHLPHGMSYPVSGHVRDYRAPGYAADHALVPHGMSVILNAPRCSVSRRRRIRNGTCSPPRRSASTSRACRPRMPAACSPTASPGSWNGCRCRTDSAPSATPPATSRRWSKARCRSTASRSSRRDRHRRTIWPRSSRTRSSLTSG